MEIKEALTVLKRVLQCHNRKPCVMTEVPCRDCPYQTTTDDVDMAIAAAIPVLENEDNGEK